MSDRFSELDLDEYQEPPAPQVQDSYDFNLVYEVKMLQRRVNQCIAGPFGLIVDGKLGYVTLRRASETRDALAAGFALCQLPDKTLLEMARGLIEGRGSRAWIAVLEWEAARRGRIL